MPNSGRKLVAISLADMANDDGECWPSLKRLAQRCDMTEDSVRDHLRHLEAIGLLSRSERFRDNRQMSNCYTFVDLESLLDPPNLGEGGEKWEGRGVKISRGEGGENHHHENHQYESSLNLQGSLSLQRPGDKLSCPSKPVRSRTSLSSVAPLLPTSEPAKRLSAIFHRRLTTAWTPSEVRAYKRLGEIETEDLEALEAYYGDNWPPQRDVNHLRHDLLTLLNNFPGEVTRAQNWLQTSKNTPKTITMSLR